MKINQDYKIVDNVYNTKQICDIFTSFGLEWTDFTSTIIDIMNRVAWKVEWNYPSLYGDLFDIFNYWGLPDEGEGLELVLEIIQEIATEIYHGKTI